MKSLKSLFQTISHGLFEYVLLFPIILIIGILLERYLDFSLWAWVLIIPAMLIMGILYKKIFKKQAWWGYGLVSLAIGIGTLSILPLGAPTTWMLFIILPAAFLRGLLYASRPWHTVLPLNILWVGGFGIYFSTYFLFRYTDMFTPYQPIITIGGAFFVLTTLFISNSERLKKATLDKSEAPYVSPTMKRQNSLLIIITIGLIIIGNLRAVQNGFMAVVGYIVRFIFSDNSEDVEEIIEEETEEQTNEMGLPEGDNSFLYPFMKFLETVVLYLFYIGMAAAIIVILFLLTKKSRAWLFEKWHAFIRFLKQLTNRADDAAQSPYIDEKETVFDWQRWKQKQTNKAKGLFDKMFRRRTNWDALSDKQKVRLVYRDIVEQKKADIAYTPALTARETLVKIEEIVEEDDKEIELLRKHYENIRYSDKDLNSENIKEIQSLIENYVRRK